MHYKDAIKQLDGERNIVVSGPQRSGTRFVAHVIAKELGYRFVDEREVGICNLERLKNELAKPDHKVIQAPALLHALHGLDFGLVVIARNIEDIINSQKRIGWDGKSEQNERDKYDSSPDRPIAVIKYEYAMENYPGLVMIDFESLYDYPDYVVKSDRLDWDRYQIERKINE